MSANNQTLIVEHGGRFYVFENVMAESWAHYDEETDTFDESRMNELPLTEASAVFDTRNEAFAKALELDEYETEYGVQSETLCKDGSPVNIIP